MKAHALEGRDKPKDVYDLCYCLAAYPDGITALAANWRARQGDSLVDRAIEILHKKFESADHFGPQQLAIFHDAEPGHEQALYARRAYELVQTLLNLL